MPAAATSSDAKSQIRFIAAIVAAAVCNMLGNATFPALLPMFTAEWRLSATEAGWISGLYYAGYVAAVPILAALTDRIEPRRVYLASTALGLATNLGFALTAQGFWSAIGWQMLAGMGLAGTYMPGLKALTDRVSGPGQSRAVASYTSGFSLGTSVSFLAAGLIGPAFGWRAAFLAAAAGSAAAWLIAFRAITPSGRDAHMVAPAALLDFRPVFANRAAMGYVLAYGCHVWELFGMRAWIVAFLAYSASLQAPGATVWNPAIIATIMSLLAVGFSIAGNELSLHFGRRRVVSAVLVVTAVAAATIGFTASLPYPYVALLCILYGGLIMGDSSSLTAGAIEAAIPGARGATMAVHSSVGFLGAFLGPLLFGVVLDWVGGSKLTIAWAAGFATFAAVGLCGPIAILLLRQKPASLRG